VRSLNKKRELIYLGIIFLIIGLISTYPLIFYINKAMPYSFNPPAGKKMVWMQQGDYLQFYYCLNLFNDTIKGIIPPFTDYYQFATPYKQKQIVTYFFPLSLIFFIFSILGKIAAYNILIILSYPITGISSYLLIRNTTKERLGALLGAMIFTIAPYRISSMMGGHPGGFVYFFIPLIIYLIDIALFENIRGIYATIIGICIFFLLINDPHYLYYLFFLLLIYIPIRFFDRVIDFVKNEYRKLIRETDRNIANIILRHPPILISILSIISFTVMISIYKSGGINLIYIFTGFLISITLAGVWLFFSWSLRGLSFLEALKIDSISYLPLILLNLYFIKFFHGFQSLGRNIIILSFVFIIIIKFIIHFKFRYSFFKNSLSIIKRYLGLILFLLLSALYILHFKFIVLEESALSRGRKIKEIMLFSPNMVELLKKGDCNYIGVFSIMIAIFFPIYIYFNRNKKDLRIQIFYFSLLIITTLLALGFNGNNILPIYKFLYTYVPFFNYIRSTNKILILTYLSCGILAGFLVKSLKRLKGVLFYPIYILLIGIIMYDFTPSGHIGLSLIDKDNKIHNFIKDRRGEYKVLYIPLWPGDSSWTSIPQYYTTITKVKMINGYSPIVPKGYFENIYLPLENINFGEIRYKEYSILKNLNVKYILLDKRCFIFKVSPYPFEFTLNNIISSGYVNYIMDDGYIWLFELKKKREPMRRKFDQRISMGIFYEAENLPRRTGKVVREKNTSNGRVVEGRKDRDRADFLIFGPYKKIPTGSYVTIFRIKGEPISGAIADIEVSVDKGRKIIAQKRIRGEDFLDKIDYKDFTLSYSLDVPKILEFRVLFYKNSDIYIDYVYTIQKGEKDPLELFEAEDSANFQRVVYDRGASGSKALHIGENKNNEGDYITNGPYRVYREGEYKAIFRIKPLKKRTSDTNIAILRVTTEYKRMILGEKIIKGEDFKTINIYKEFKVPFKLKSPTALEFPLYLMDNNADFYFDSVKVIRLR